MGQYAYGTSLVSQGDIQPAGLTGLCSADLSDKTCDYWDDQFPCVGPDPDNQSTEKEIVPGSVVHGRFPAPDRLVGQVAPGSSIEWLHVDHLGSTRVVTDQNGEVVSRHKYLPFGQEFTDAGADQNNTHKFTGHERDKDTGLDYMMARYYEASFGRFLSPDPLPGYLLLPQTLNQYIYAGNNPTRFTDPTGLDFFLQCSGEDTDTCQGGHAGTTSVDDDGNKTFTPTVISNDDEGNLVDQDNNLYTAEVDGDGVQFTDQASGDTTPGVWQRDSADVSFDQASGALNGFRFTFTDNPGFGQDARGTFSFTMSRSDANKALEKGGLDFDSGGRPGADWRSPGDNQHNATHFNFNSRTGGGFHTGETNRGVSGHAWQAFRNMLEALPLVPRMGGDE